MSKCLSQSFKNIHCPTTKRLLKNLKEVKVESQFFKKKYTLNNPKKKKKVQMLPQISKEKNNSPNTKRFITKITSIDIKKKKKKLKFCNNSLK